jgi:hypothetical protein
MIASGYTQAFTSVTGFWLEGAPNSEEAELLSPRRALPVPLEFVVPALKRILFLDTSVERAFTWGDLPWER